MLQRDKKSISDDLISIELSHLGPVSDLNFTFKVTKFQFSGSVKKFLNSAIHAAWSNHFNSFLCEHIFPF